MWRGRGCDPLRGDVPAVANVRASNARRPVGFAPRSGQLSLFVGDDPSRAGVSTSRGSAQLSPSSNRRISPVVRYERSP